MKNELKNIGLFLLNILRRILFVVLSIVLWPIYIATTAIFVPIEFFVSLLVLPILWIFIGTKNINIICNLLFYRHNKELWHKDYTTVYNNDGSFISLIPMWAFYVQEKWLSKLISEDLY